MHRLPPYHALASYSVIAARPISKRAFAEDGKQTRRDSELSVEEARLMSRSFQTDEYWSDSESSLVLDRPTSRQTYKADEHIRAAESMIAASSKAYESHEHRRASESAIAAPLRAYETDEHRRASESVIAAPLRAYEEDEHRRASESMIVARPISRRVYDPDEHRRSIRISDSSSTKSSWGRWTQKSIRIRNRRSAESRWTQTSFRISDSSLAKSIWIQGSSGISDNRWTDFKKSIWRTCKNFRSVNHKQ